MKKNDIKQMLRIAIFSAVFAVSSWISVPAAIPFTFQTFALFFSFMMLGGASGAASALIYICLGAVGLPVFSGFGAGFGAIFGAGGGFIIAFPIAGLLYAALEALCGTGRKRKLIYSAVAMALIYVCGSLWFSLVYAKGTTFAEALAVTVIPFIVPDIIKIALAFYVSERMNSFRNNNCREVKKDGKRKN